MKHECVFTEYLGVYEAPNPEKEGQKAEVGIAGCKCGERLEFYTNSELREKHEAPVRVDA